MTRDGFDKVVLPHLDAGYRLAGWLVRNEHDAQDVVQEAALRAFRHLGTFTGGNGRAWFLTIVRNTCNGLRRQRFRRPENVLFDEQRHGPPQVPASPESLLLRADNVMLIERAMGGLPKRSRELLRLRELEGLSYREIATVMGIPIGTVMSGLARARRALRDAASLAQSDRLESTSYESQDRTAGA